MPAAGAIGLVRRGLSSRLDVDHMDGKGPVIIALGTSATAMRALSGDHEMPMNIPPTAARHTVSLSVPSIDAVQRLGCRHV